ncbi:serpin-ZX-like [Neltuma alba]|uniref:serpin-ZX-like n=1 Tax=Neltuma alba TaxID=207710 RepID=UPI0010A445E1|nr:serpin-ZX-like [Prosopis alba]
MRLNLLRRPSITPWLERSVLSFFFCPVLANQTASYCCGTGAGRKTRRGPRLYSKAGIFANQLLGGDTGEERVFSTSSFNVVLSLLAAGSSVCPRRQLLAVIDRRSVDRLNSLAARPDVILPYDDLAEGIGTRCVNALWLDQSLTLKPSFKQILDSDYRAALNPPPHATQEINSWAENETSCLVKDFIREGFLSNSVKFVFTNAIHFKGAWKGTSNPTFISKNSEMDTLTSHKSIAFSKGMKLVYQPFKKQRKYNLPLSMVFRFAVKDTDQVRREHVTETLKNLCGHDENPKFNTAYEVEVSDTLRGVGVTLPFSGGKWKGIFSSFGARKLYVSSIFQKSFMEINEQGAEVVSVTAAVVMSGCPPRLPPVPALDYEHHYSLHASNGTTAKAASVMRNLTFPAII